MGGPAPDVTPEQLQEVLAHQMPPDLRLAARMPKTFSKFHNLDAIVHHMYEKGWISKETFEGTQNSRFSYKQKMPAEAAQDYIEGVMGAKNPAPVMAMVSQAAGARRRGDKVEPILRSEVPGMDPRSIQQVINDPLVTEELSLSAGMEFMQIMAAKMANEGEIEDEDVKEFTKVSNTFLRLLDKMMGKKKD